MALLKRTAFSKRLTPHYVQEHPGFKRNKLTLLSMGIAVVLVGLSWVSIHATENPTSLGDFALYCCLCFALLTVLCTCTRGLAGALCARALLDASISASSALMSMLGICTSQQCTQPLCAWLTTGVT